MTPKKFFDKRTAHSEVKARIVAKYFSVWAKVMMPTAAKSGKDLAYIDLYAGPGRYRDRSVSTPLLILMHALKDENLSRLLKSYFNDDNQNHVASLKREIHRLKHITNLKHKPAVSCHDVRDLTQQFTDGKLVPSFSFLDPCGYKGLTQDIIRGVIKDWGCDCVFFFNYNRINAGIANNAVAPHMNALFGKGRANELRSALRGLSPKERECLIVSELKANVRDLGAKYVLPFTFKNDHGTRTSHILIFVSKHFRGYSIMKDIMAAESSTCDQDVPSFTYSPANAKELQLFSMDRPLDRLRDSLQAAFSGKDKKFDDIYKAHCVDTPYVRRNYRVALKRLEQDGAIRVRSSNSSRRPGTFSRHVTISFPKESSLVQ